MDQESSKKKAYEDEIKTPAGLSDKTTPTFGNEGATHQVSIPMLGKQHAPGRGKTRPLVHDAVVGVSLSPYCIGNSERYSIHRERAPDLDHHIEAKMIISIWTLDNQRYFTLTFASSDKLRPPALHPVHRSSPRSGLLPFDVPSPKSSAASGNHSPWSTPSSALTSPTNAPLVFSPFPPLASLARSDAAISSSVLQKVTRMKDAIINTLEMPMFAMWKDESLVIPNRACVRLLQGEETMSPTAEDSNGMISRWKIYTEDFKRQYLPEEYPITQLCRTQKPFKRWKVGMVDSQGRRRIFDVNGDGLYDEKTGEFLAGIVALNDVTEYTDMIKTQNEENEQQFQLICDTMPQMVRHTILCGICAELTT